VAIYPLLEEIVQNLPQHKMILGTGAGTRARHAYAEALDLGMPTGVLSVLGFLVSMQNARMLGYLLAKHGIPMIETPQFDQLPLYLAERRAAIFIGSLPYTYWQPNPSVGRLPAHRKAVETKLRLQAEYVVWRASVVVPSQTHGAPGRGKRISERKSVLPETDPGAVTATGVCSCNGYVVVSSPIPA
jgi:molybdenum storage protein